MKVDGDEKGCSFDIPVEEDRKEEEQQGEEEKEQDRDIIHVEIKFETETEAKIVVQSKDEKLGSIVRDCLHNVAVADSPLKMI